MISLSVIIPTLNRSVFEKTGKILKYGSRLISMKECKARTYGLSLQVSCNQIKGN